MPCPLRCVKIRTRSRRDKFFHHEGIVTDQRNVVAWGPRLEALDMAMNVRGLYQKQRMEAKEKGFNVIKVVIINRAFRPKRDPMKDITPAGETITLP